MDTLHSPPAPAVETTPSRPARRRGLTLRRLERLLYVVAFLALAAYATVAVDAYLYQLTENRELDSILRSREPSRQQGAESSMAEAQPRPLHAGALIGRIEIARLGVTAVVLSGTDASTLRRSVGHIPGTAMPGTAGNVGLAGHRDTFFRRLEDIQENDEVVVTTLDGVFRYRVVRTVVVTPADVWVLDPTTDATLTLVTCFPFSFFGAAPDRFIVRATLRS